MLLGGESEGLTAVLDQLAHLANTFGALRRALVHLEDIAGTSRARLDGCGDIALAKTIAVADVHAGASLNENGSS